LVGAWATSVVLCTHFPENDEEPFLAYAL